MSDAIEFDATLARVQSMADGSPRVVLDLPEYNQPQANDLWTCKLSGAMFKVMVIPVIVDTLNEED